MQSRGALVAIIVCVVLVIGGGLYLAKRSGQSSLDEGTPSGATEKPAAPTGVQVKGVELEEVGPDGKVVWQVTAGAKLEVDQNTSRVMGRDVTLLVAVTGKPPVRVVAPVFSADAGRKTLLLEKGVSGTLPGTSGSFHVGRLEYQPATGKLIGAEGARLEKDGYTAQAARLVVDTRGDDVRLSGGVTFARGIVGPPGQ